MTNGVGDHQSDSDQKYYCEFTKNDEIMLVYFARIMGETLKSADLLRNAEISRDRATGLLNLLQSFQHV